MYDSDETYIKYKSCHARLNSVIFFLGMAIFGHFTNRLTGNSSDRLTG